ncbi:cytochrome c [Methylovorus menthalis]|uniref:c-type cytochrome n=1 Tax=Methylovorus menthalis TaxID=1002227 RepID=UPI001E5C0431|nr:cytochrome c [Methylovorus menthalis]MCB4812222.1 cytochrome c [Methylovorus menthalis]
MKLIAPYRIPVLGVLMCMSGSAFAQTPQYSPHIQVLAASCAACHGTDGNSVGGTPVLAGLDSLYFIRQMKAFRSGERQATVMQRHAKGLTEDEIVGLAAFFATQPRVAGKLPPSMKLEPSHDH